MNRAFEDDAPRAYFVFTSRDAAERPEVGDFLSWLLREAKRDEQTGGR